MNNWDNTGYTVELGKLCEQVKLWDFDYPSYYTGAEKAAFEQKVIDHYYFRQIGFETPARFVHKFRSRIRDIMPYYIRLYESVKIMDDIEDPFGNVDIVETFEQENTSMGTHSDTSENSTSGNVERSENETRTDESSTNGVHKESDTPQSSISNIDTYLTRASKDDGSTSTDSTGTRNSTDTSSTSSTATGSGTTSNTGTTKHTLTRKGNQGVNTYAHDMKEFREILINVDMLIIDDLKTLFLGVY